MIKSYLLTGSLMLSSILMVGGSSYYNNSENADKQIRFAENSSSEAGISSNLTEPVPMPLWIMQKIFGVESATATPVPCPVWMLYYVGKSSAGSAPVAKTKI